MKSFTLLVKPASADCNVRCRYCFYLDRRALYPDTRAHRMSDEVLERMVAGYLATSQPTYAFGWQGGEPLLMGLDFYRKVTALQVQHGRSGAVVANGLQTNGLLLDDALAQHLAEYKFLVGVSLDGPAEYHDVYRRTADGRPTHADVLNGIAALQRHSVEFNILTLVSTSNVGHPREVYRYLRERGFLFHQYIPCVEFGEHGDPLPYTITGRQWGDFLCGVFDEWIRTDVRKVSVRLFDSILVWLVTGERNVCHFQDDCRQYFVVEHNGDIYPCDFFVEQPLRLGNVLNDSWESMLASPLYRQFGLQKAQRNPCCERCPHVGLCAADCLKHRLNPGGDPRRLSWLCAGWRQFYDHSLKHFRRLADGLQRERPVPDRRSMLA